jgi:hypothetical protein
MMESVGQFYLGVFIVHRVMQLQAITGGACICAAQLTAVLVRHAPV